MADTAGIEAFKYDLTSEQKSIVNRIHGLVSSYPGVHVKMRYKIPFYYRYSWIAYINPLKTGGVEFAFLEGKNLSAANSGLRMKNRKLVAGIDIVEARDIDEDFILETFNEALLLDELKHPPKK